MAAVGEHTMPLLRRAEALVGLPYVEGEFDCGHLVVRAARELFGREVELPIASPHPVSARGQAAALAVCRRMTARALLPYQAVQPGDLALFTEVDSGGVTRHWHVGLVIETQPEFWILHTRAGDASVLARLVDCIRQGLALEGWYRWT